MTLLSSKISVKRRYSRSINLERDLLSPDSVLGYVPTSRSIESLDRILNAIVTPRSTSAWTITGVYGTGKSSFAHFLTSLCAPYTEPIHKNALKVIDEHSKLNKAIKHHIANLPKSGLIRAIATAQREPIAHTIVRALFQGIAKYKTRGRRPYIFNQINKLMEKISKGKRVNNDQALNSLCKLAKVSGILIIVDELGKNLEYAANSNSQEDLFLLQQIAELPSETVDTKIVFLGILHQAFTEYANDLSQSQRNEWGKIQGRFEDIPFADSNSEMFQLIGHAIDQTKAGIIRTSINKWGKKWASILKTEKYINPQAITNKTVSALFPLNPVAAIVLPNLCSRYAQNDRSLFTFMSSTEPYSLASFLKEESRNQNLPTLKLDRLYDYFVESAGISSSSRVQNQRWVEIHGRISDATGLDEDFLSVLKVVGLLNLVFLSGPLKATSQLVAYALSESPDDKEAIKYWKKIIAKLCQKGFIAWRKKLDELRIWEGSDFDIEQAIAENSDLGQKDLCELLSETCSLTPLVAHRHSYETGTLRYFERSYISDIQDLEKIKLNNSHSDGVIYLLITDKNIPKEIGIQYIENKPLVLICPTVDTKAIRKTCVEYAALRRIQKKCPELQSDGVARREVRYRLAHTKQALDTLMLQAFGSSDTPIYCWIKGKPETLKNTKELSSQISELCDGEYNKSLRLWNELLNRQKLTAQAVTARRKLINGIISNSDKERLGIEGNGPEYCMYSSVLAKTGIHKLINNKWTVGEPRKRSGILHAWRAIERFCLSAKSSPETLDNLYEILSSRPYGIKEGVIPVLITAFLMTCKDNIALYHNDTFLPVTNESHFDLLAKNPKWFSVKHFELTGLRSQVFKELEKVIVNTQNRTKHKTRNSTLLAVVKPLVRFASTLPIYTTNTKSLSNKASNVRNTLLQAREPDQLLFWDLPKACGLKPITNRKKFNIEEAKEFRLKLVTSLKEIQNCYDHLLAKCKELLYEAFSVRGDKGSLREDLRVRAKYLSDCIEPQLKRFVLAAISDEKDDRKWLEALLMVIVDKPAESWRDIDVSEFELNLIEIARKFNNLEALKLQCKTPLGEGFIARKITITQPNGKEINEVVWMDPSTETKVEEIVKSLLDKHIPDKNEQLLKSILCSISDQLFSAKAIDVKLSNIKRESKHA